MNRRLVICFVILVLACTAGRALAQTMPTGTVTGKVTDPSGLPVPGATITVTSPALQGSRTAVSSGNGDYAIPFLPPGDYLLIVEISGFETHTRQLRVLIASTQK